jgi:hypothetical protein
MNGAQIVQQYGGLTPGTTYYFRIGCGPAGRIGRYQGTFTTAAAPGAATTIPLSLTVPPNRGVATVRVDYGATSGLGSNVSAACATTCTVNVPATKNKVLYYRITYLDSGNGVIGSGRVLAAVGL